MPRYYVISPDYQTVDPILLDGTGPTETRCDFFQCDFFQIEAATPEEAKTEAVRRMRRQPQSWLQDGVRLGDNTFTGLRVVLADE